MKKGKRQLCLAFVVFALFFGLQLKVQAAEQQDTILKGFYIEDINLSGMTIEEANKVVEERVELILSSQITLVYDIEREVTLSAKELGVSWYNTDVLDDLIFYGKSGNIVKRFKEREDIEKNNIYLHLEFKIDEKETERVLDKNCSVFDIEKTEPYLVRENKIFTIVSGQEGVKLDIEKSTADFKDYILNQWTWNDFTFNLATTVISIEHDETALNEVTDVLGNYSTSFYSSGADRSTNVRNAASRINGQTLYPGDEFSTLTLFLPFTMEAGYAVGNSYAGGRVVESIGGGVCQVSSTLYNAVLNSELLVTNRKNHGLMVAYVPLGCDATISEASETDFKWVNDTDYPVYVECYTTSNKRVVVNIYGHETRDITTRTIGFETEVLSETPAVGEKVYTDSKKDIGTYSISSAHTGYDVKLWKIEYKDGVEYNRYVVNRSVYKSSPRSITVGTKTDDANLRAKLQEAIATGSVDYVKQVANNIKNGAYGSAPVTSDVTNSAESTDNSQDSDSPEV